MSNMNRLNDEALKNVTGGMAGIVDTGTDQNAVVRSGAGKAFEQIDSLPNGTICYMTGKTYTSFRRNEKKQRPFSILKIGLVRPREELYERINRRVDQMMADGLLEEARRVYPKRHLNALNTVGYKELFNFLDGTWSLEEAIERIKGNTRRYCRKQLTWLKHDPAIQWFHPDNFEEIIKYIESHT